MIFVTLGTQDKSFVRLLEAIDKEIEKGNIKEKVVVQAGYTKYNSSNMEIFDLIAPDKFDELMDKADLVITHGGAGSILTAIKKGKVVIAAPRLKKYKEHTNDHQKEIVGEFSKDGYILELRDFNKLSKMLEKAKNFKPKKFKSNTENMINLISDYIEEDNHTSWFNKSLSLIKYTVFFLIYAVISHLLLIYGIHINKFRLVYLLLIGFFLVISYFVNKLLIFKKKNSVIYLEILLYLICSLGLFVCLSYFDNYFVRYFLLFILSYLINKYFIFRK